ncbi:MAG: SAM-dependent methyltransferase [Verrucomicrobiae bacterium]|nr:SAM-dependent methyltransferase [Verrucomicrobiae bacterium]
MNHKLATQNCFSFSLQPSAFSLSSSLQPVASCLSFAEFMEQALYDPEHGYYASGRVHIGKAGDFFTNVSVGKIYGKILALFFEELWEKMGQPEPFTIVEQGANDGRLALDILEAAEASSDFFKSIHYYIVEPFSIHQKKQQETLKQHQNVSWVKKIIELPEFEGLHFSNELLDAFPIDLLRWNGEEWLEQRIAAKAWVTLPIEQEELQSVAKKLPHNLAPEFLWEVRLGIVPWLQEIEVRMKRGIILIADYGYAGIDRFASYRAEGSIACYENHHRHDNPLEEVGKRDITAHVDFTDLAEKALQRNFEILGYSDQHHFLIGAAETWLRTFEGRSLTTAEQKEFRLLQTLLHPETMGRSFKFLGLGKKISTTAALSGFCYQRPGVAYLFGS